MDKIKFYLTNRFILLLVTIVLFCGLHYLLTDSILPDTSTKNVWFYSGLFMLFFSILFIEPYYSSPKNVITNSIPLLLVYLSIRSSFKNDALWYVTIALISVLIIFSIVAIALASENESPVSLRNKLSNRIKNIAVFIGRGKVIYSFVFISILVLYKSEIIAEVSDSYLFTMITLWGLVLIIDPKSLHNTFIRETTTLQSNAIGEIFGVQSKKIFLTKLFEDRSKSIKRFDIVTFKYSMQDSDTYAIAGIVFDTYLLNQEKWIKILQLGTTQNDLSRLKRNIVYKTVKPDEIQYLSDSLRISDFVGVVIEKSSIGTIKFEYSKQTDDIQEGDLLELKVGNRRLFYQVVSGTTELEKLESKNESGFIEGEAIQLGEWQNDVLSFQKFGWVPSINTPIFKADTSNIEVDQYQYPDFELGTIPGTTLPSVINLHEAISHHTALIGVTGSGKSFLAREIIDQLKTDTKVICIDFTGEWKKKLQLTKLNSGNLDAFLAAQDDSIGLVELPTVSNTVGVIQSTENFISLIFSKAKEAYEANTPMRICLVLEEAHTIVPEGNFMGVNDWESKAVVNKMGQVALQGRKYGVGLLVIAQRTANVSKTVLTQCNTIVCYQAFDETSFNFLGNYIGRDLVQALPNLKRYHAIVTGKAIRSNLPMIVNLEREVE
ncbi:hypothetical protein B4Q04_07500 [Zobellia sp. OII3]|uniref:helicase HerA domain-containing protein n=1 Tax=Zobellia sp. OII3 TaxID=2034520 RepID=UPI000B52B2C7|nr:DUF87 domain-containing protein [Zobellia sp. OII3]OWW25455.1 hypothetical protein B4Q04_07500 [Zobellia sp. OII3]